MSGPLIPPAEVETRIRDAALVLLDLAVAATPAHEDERARILSAYSLATQALMMAEDLRPGAAMPDRLAKLGNLDLMTRIMGGAFGVGETIGCLRQMSGQSLLLMAAAQQLGDGVARRNRTMQSMGLS